MGVNERKREAKKTVKGRRRTLRKRKRGREGRREMYEEGGN